MADSLILHRGAMAGRKEEAEEFPRCVTSALFRVICFVTHKSSVCNIDLKLGRNYR